MTPSFNTLNALRLCTYTESRSILIRAPRHCRLDALNWCHTYKIPLFGDITHSRVALHSCTHQHPNQRKNRRAKNLILVLRSPTKMDTLTAQWELNQTEHKCKTNLVRCTTSYGGSMAAQNPKHPSYNQTLSTLPRIIWSPAQYNCW